VRAEWRQKQGVTEKERVRDESQRAFHSIHGLPVGPLTPQREEGKNGKRKNKRKGKSKRKVITPTGL
jgi:hypothetical protein